MTTTGNAVALSVGTKAKQAGSKGGKGSQVAKMWEKAPAKSKEQQVPAHKISTGSKKAAVSPTQLNRLNSLGQIYFICLHGVARRRICLSLSFKVDRSLWNRIDSQEHSATPGMQSYMHIPRFKTVAKVTL